jgi:hypothetical protein
VGVASGVTGVSVGFGVSVEIAVGNSVFAGVRVGVKMTTVGVHVELGTAVDGIGVKVKVRNGVGVLLGRGVWLGVAVGRTGVQVGKLGTNNFCPA